MIRMIATTISNSISEKPFCFRISFSLFSDLKFFGLYRPTGQHIRTLLARARVTKESGCPRADGSFLWRIMPFVTLLSHLGLLQIPRFCVRFCRRLTNCVILRPGEQLFPGGNTGSNPVGDAKLYVFLQRVYKCLNLLH